MTGDRGAQPERTRLAWRRTALASTVLTLLGIRLATLDALTPTAAVTAGLFALAWVATLIGVQRRIAALAARPPRAMRSPWPLLAGVAVLTAVALSLAALIRAAG